MGLVTQTRWPASDSGALNFERSSPQITAVRSSSGRRGPSRETWAWASAQCGEGTSLPAHALHVPQRDLLLGTGTSTPPSPARQPVRRNATKISQERAAYEARSAGRGAQAAEMRAIAAELGISSPEHVRRLLAAAGVP